MHILSALHYRQNGQDTWGRGNWFLYGAMVGRWVPVGGGEGSR